MRCVHTRATPMSGWQAGAYLVGEVTPLRSVGAQHHHQMGRSLPPQLPAIFSEWWHCLGLVIINVYLVEAAIPLLHPVGALTTVRWAARDCVAILDPPASCLGRAPLMILLLKVCLFLFVLGGRR